MIDMVFLLLIFFLVNAQMIVVKLDKDVQPPIAKHTVVDEVRNGRIVINILKEGEYRNEESQPLMDDAAIEAWIKEQKAINDQRGYTSRLHIRGDKNTVFKHCRKVLRIGARLGVDKVIFATYQVE
jgi:biopolymer transport protein ExbD